MRLRPAAAALERFRVSKIRPMGHLETVAEWKEIFYQADIKMRRPENVAGVKLVTPLGEMNLRRVTDERYCAWINSRGMCFGSSPALAVANLAYRIIDRTPYATNVLQ